MPSAGSVALNKGDGVDGRLDILLLAVGNLRCALPRSAVHSILPVPHLWRPPALPRPLLGFAEVDGAAVPVVGLRQLFGLDEGSGQPAPPFYAHIILLQEDAAAGDSRVALLVDRAVDLLSVAPEALLPVSGGVTLNGCVRAEIETADGLVSLLDAEKILLAEERSRLSELTQAAAARRAEWHAL